MIRICGGKFILNEPNLYATLGQHTQLFQNIHSISSEPGYRSGNDDVQLALPTVINHPVEVFPINHLKTHRYK